MSGAFCFGDLDYSVSNVRFANLLRWVVNCALDVQYEKKDVFMAKMSGLVEDLFIPIGMLNFHEHFEVDELQFWSDVFFKMGVDIYEGRVGNQTNREWQPTAIADAIQISRLLNDLVRKIERGLVKDNP